MPSRLVTDDDTGLKVLVEGTGAKDAVDIVAVHGRGAHPDDTWCELRASNLDVKRPESYINWLSDKIMLPATVPSARIMRYGYDSAWFGHDRIATSPRIISQRLLGALNRKRKDCPRRPLIIVAHSFGGLIVLQMLNDANLERSKWPYLYEATVGLVFFGTPFRGTQKTTITKIVELAEQKFGQDQVLGQVFRASEADDEALTSLVEQYLRTARETVRPKVACFFEQKPTNVARIVNSEETYETFWVDEKAGTLDITESVEKYSRPRDHLKLNKFHSADDEDFQTLAEVFEAMVKEGPEIIARRTQPKSGRFVVPFSLEGVPNTNHFVKRETEMRQMDALFDPEKASLRRIAVLHGMGGIGKTQLVADFARRHKKSFTAVFWIDGSTKDAIRRGLAACVARLPREGTVEPYAESTKGEKIDTDALIKRLMAWLAQPENTNWLLVFDNVDKEFPSPTGDPQAYDFVEHLPASDHGSVLVTTRLASLKSQGKSILISKANEDQAQEMLESDCNGGRNPITNAEPLIKELDGLPLALVQAGAYLREHPVSVSEYLTLYRDTWKRLNTQDEFGLTRNIAQSIATTWTVSVEQIRQTGQRGRDAVKLLMLWAYLDNNGLWYELFCTRRPRDTPGATDGPFDDPHQKASRGSIGTPTAQQTTLPGWLKRVVMDETAFRAVLGILLRFSLVSTGSKTSTYFVHPVVHLWSLHHINSDSEKYCLRFSAVTIVTEAIKRIDKNSSYIDRERLSPHMSMLSRRAADWRTPNAKLTKKMFNVAFAASEWGNTYTVGELYQQVLKGFEKAWGLEHTSTLEIVNNFAALYADQGKMKEAEEMYQRALKGKEKAWGLEHTSTLETVNNLALLYADQGKMKEAEEMYQRALKGKEKAWGLEHTSTLDTVNNLAALYADQGKINEAEEMFQRALKGFEKAWGLEHTSTLNTVNNLAILYKNQGKMNEAEEMYQRALKGKEKA